MSTTEQFFYPGPRDADHPLEPCPELIRRCVAEPVSTATSWSGESWLITGYDEAKQAFTSEALSADPQAPGYPEKSASYAATLSTDRTLRALDDPVHAQHKRMIMENFTVRAVEQMRPRLEQLVNELLNSMLSSPASAVDLVTALALPLPTTAICEILGVPYDDRAQFAHHAKVCFDSESTLEQAATAGQQVKEYLVSLVDDRRVHPTTDLIGRLVTDRLSTGELTVNEVVQMARLILLAGHETTANSITLSVVALFTNPQQLAIRCADWGPLRKCSSPWTNCSATFHRPTWGRRRACIAETEIGGKQILPGQGVIIANNVADRDPHIFENPEELDLLRANAKDSLTFGWGTHQCPGRYLGRVELQIVHSALWRRIPTLRLAVPVNELQFKHTATVFGLVSLPVTWDQN